MARWSWGDAQPVTSLQNRSSVTVGTVVNADRKTLDNSSAHAAQDAWIGPGQASRCPDLQGR
ncbi:MAG: hypothetical protein R3D43_09900 [Tepidamorphaceae bacterium]